MGGIKPGTGGCIFLDSILISIRWPLMLLCCGLFSHCALRPIPRDLAVYVNRDIYAVAELENLGLKRYAALTGDNYISDTALREALAKEIIPAYSQFADLARRIEPKTEPVQKLHSLYRKAADYRLKGFRMILQAVDTQDRYLVSQANRMLDQGRQFIEQWRASLVELTAQYGLENKGVHNAVKSAV
jgi:hypothetical protein